ncbi:MAG TPA: methyltransferase domain-containing protein [Alphaproteobacteria bacterium]
MNLRCPLDGLPLISKDNIARCSGNHSFDWAKEGYLNLLPVHAKQSKDPGDSPDMVQARRRFLKTGHYNPIIDAIIAQIGNRNVILDAGCGEGYYLGRIKNALPDTDLYGLDISKHAVRAAAKTHKDVTWLVASNRQLPFPARSLDVIICAFGFPVWHEFHRVLKPDGIVILVDPAENHLLELRQRLYTEIKHKDTLFAVPDGMICIATQNLSYSFALPEPGLICDLIAMTPHQHRVSQATIDQVSTSSFPKLTAHVTFNILQPEIGHG